jgi:hypothetical protein
MGARRRAVACRRRAADRRRFRTTEGRHDRDRGVDVVRLGDVDIAFAREEGEGFESVSHWRDAHEMFWTDEVMPRLAERARCTLDGDTLVVRERFRVVLAPNQ